MVKKRIASVFALVFGIIGILTCPFLMFFVHSVFFAVPQSRENLYRYRNPDRNVQKIYTITRYRCVEIHHKLVYNISITKLRKVYP